MLTVEEKPIVSMARKNLPICVLDDEADLVDLTTERLTKLGFPVAGTTNPQDALQKIRLGGCRAVIADFKMPAMDGLALLEKVLQYDPGIYVILVTDYYSVDAAIDAIKRGAYDSLPKPLDFARLTKTLDDLADLFTQRSQIRDLEDRLLQNLQFHGTVGRSPAMFEVFDLAKRLVGRSVCQGCSRCLYGALNPRPRRFSPRLPDLLLPPPAHRRMVRSLYALQHSATQSQFPPVPPYSFRWRHALCDSPSAPLARMLTFVQASFRGFASLLGFETKVSRCGLGL